MLEYQNFESFCEGACFPRVFSELELWYFLPVPLELIKQNPKVLVNEDGKHQLFSGKGPGRPHRKKKPLVMCRTRSPITH